MAGTLKLMSMALARYSRAGRHFSGVWGGSAEDVATLMRRVKMETEWTDLRSFQLRRLRVDRSGTIGRTPIGVVVGGGAERVLVAKATTLLADASPLGYLRIPTWPTPFRGATARGARNFTWWQNREPHRKSAAEWVSSPHSEPDLPFGRPPIVVDVDRGLRVGGGDLVDLLSGDRFLRAALDAHPGADIVLRAQVPRDDLKLIANATGRTAHCPNGFTEIFRWSELGSGDPDALPFLVKPDVLDSIRHSLDNAPPIWQRSAAASDWALTATWVDVTESGYLRKLGLGSLEHTPPFQTCVPDIEHRLGFAEHIKYELSPAVRWSTWRRWIAKD